MSMLSNAYAKEISALKLKKYRESHRKFVVEGPNLVEEALQQEMYPIESVVGTPSLFEKLSSPIPAEVTTYEADERELKKLSALKTPYDGLAVLKFRESDSEINESLLLYMDALQDPGNLGTIIRSADWFGIPHILLGKGTVDPFNPKCIRASMGAIFRVKLSAVSENELAELSNNYNFVAADTKGTPLQSFKLQPKSIIFIGNEGRGITKATEPYIKQRLMIPSVSTNQSDSLNAGISASIIMYELGIKKTGK